MTTFGTQALLCWTTVTAFLIQGYVVLALLIAPATGAFGSEPIDTSRILLQSYLSPALIAIPAMLLAALGGAPRYRAVGWALVWVAALTAALTFVRQSFPLDAVNSTALARIGLAAIFSLPIIALLGRAPGRLGSVALALLLGALLALPSLAWGALGSLLDTARAAAEALSIGLIGAAALAILRPLFTNDREGMASDVWLAGATLSAALTSVAGAWGQDDQNLLLLLILPILGFPAAALARPAMEQRAIGWFAALLLLALTTFAPLALFDPREIIALSILSGDTAVIALAAALTTSALALFLGITAAFIGARPRAAGSIVTWGLALVALAGAGTTYATVGQPGLHGDDFFVIMREQADLSSAAAIDDVDERRATVYRTLTEHANTTQAELRAFLDGRGVDYTAYYLINAIEVHGDAMLRREIESRTDIDRVLLSPELRPLPGEIPTPEASDTTVNGSTWGIRAINADRVWDELNVTGEGVVIGQSDSGVDWQHPALREQYRGRDGSHDYNWIDPWQDRPEPYDLSGHGTHTLGSMLGSDGIGVAPDATWFGCASLVRNLGSPAYYLDCMQFLLAPYPRGGDPLTTGRTELAADVSNNSWGCPPEEGCDARALEAGVAALRAAGIFVVASAGNDGPGCDSLSSPIATYGESFSVGALDEFGDLAPFSSRGPDSELPDERRGPDIIAPGVDIVSAWPGGGYAPNDGTSMAGPHVAGVVALMWSANPALRGDIETTSRILRETAQPYEGAPPPCSTGERPDPATGYGIVDAFAAVEAAVAER
jgi:hypothetical protein